MPQDGTVIDTQHCTICRRTDRLGWANGHRICLSCHRAMQKTAWIANPTTESRPALLTQVIVRVDPELLVRLRAIVARTRIKQADLLREALADLVEHYEAKE